MESSPPQPEASLASGVMLASFQRLQSLLPAGKLDLSFTTQNGRQIVTLKAELSGTGAQPGALRPPPTRPATTFRKFRKLPLNIQVTIWKLAFQERRIFRLNGKEIWDDGHTWIPVVVPHKPPSSSQACRHSRILYHKETKCGLGSGHGTYKSLRFSPSRDMIYLDKDIIFWDTIVQHTSSINNFENVAVNLPKTGRELQMLLYQLFKVKRRFPDMKNLILVMEHKTLPSNTNVTFFDTDDNTRIFFDGHFLMWEQLQEKVQGVFHRLSLPHQAFAEPPSFRAVEVAPLRARRVRVIFINLGSRYAMPSFLLPPCWVRLGQNGLVLGFVSVIAQDKRQASGNHSLAQGSP